MSTIVSGQILRRLLLWLLLASLGGCASIDFDEPKPVSQAIPEETGSHLKALVEPGETLHEGQSAFHLLQDGIDALAARVAMSRLAEHTIDAQYYLVYDDPVGAIFLNSLLHAADRGVRVRLLIDDFLTRGTDPGLIALHGHPNIDVRLFNPFAWRSVRALNIHSFRRINRRMHNKSFIADNQVAIIGGRNIGEEYFAAASKTNFGDLDILTAGPLVNATSRMFDSYWNHRKAIPADRVIASPVDPEVALERFRQRALASADRLQDTPWARSKALAVQSYLENREKTFGWGPAELIYDAPDKAVRSEARNPDNLIVSRLRATAFGADDELAIISPYFVPSKSVMQELTSLAQSGVSVYVFTNSLAANNHTLVHSGYAPKRRPLLEAGVKIYEVKPDIPPPGSEQADLGASRSTLHTKGFLVDREMFFIGSYNWDPRSDYLNTEMGAVILQGDLVVQVKDILKSKLDYETYELFLDEKGRLRWRDRRGDEVKIWTHEPEAGFWRRFWSGFLGIFPLDSQL